MNPTNIIVPATIYAISILISLPPFNTIAKQLIVNKILVDNCVYTDFIPKQWFVTQRHFLVISYQPKLPKLDFPNLYYTEAIWRTIFPLSKNGTGVSPAKILDILLL